MAAGGARPGAGRPKGRRSDKTNERLEAIEASGLSPLAYLLDLMRDVEVERHIRLDAAKAAAQYIHPKLSAIAHTGSLEVTKPDELSDSLLAHIASAGSPRAAGPSPVEEQPPEVH